MDRIITIAAGCSAAVLAILTRHHVLTPADSESAGVIVAAVIASYHGGKAVERRSSKPVEK